MNPHNLTDTSLLIGVGALKVSIYPNPAKGGMFSIRFNQPATGIYTIKDITGKLINTAEFKEIAELRITGDNYGKQLAKGIYIIEISTPTLHKIQKLAVD